MLDKQSYIAVSDRERLNKITWQQRVIVPSWVAKYMQNSSKGQVLAIVLNVAIKGLKEEKVMQLMVAIPMLSKRTEKCVSVGGRGTLQIDLRFQWKSWHFHSFILGIQRFNCPDTTSEGWLLCCWWLIWPIQNEAKNLFFFIETPAYGY